MKRSTLGGRAAGVQQGEQPASGFCGGFESPKTQVGVGCNAIARSRGENRASAHTWEGQTNGRANGRADGRTDGETGVWHDQPTGGTWKGGLGVKERTGGTTGRPVETGPRNSLRRRTGQDAAGPGRCGQSVQSTIPYPHPGRTLFELVVLAGGAPPQNTEWNPKMGGGGTEYGMRSGCSHLTSARGSATKEIGVPALHRSWASVKESRINPPR